MRACNIKAAAERGQGGALGAYTCVLFQRKAPNFSNRIFFFFFFPPPLPFARMADTRRDSLVLYLTLHSVFSN